MSVKHDKGKTRAHLVLSDFANALEAVAEVGTFGANIYSESGWLNVPDGEKRYLDALMRHYLEHCKGVELDEESGLKHLAHFAWNALAVLELKVRRRSE